MRSELFIITPGMWKASNRDEINATFEAMRELDIARLPYHHCTIRLPAAEFITFRNPKWIAKNGGLFDADRNVDHIYCDITVSDPRHIGNGMVDLEMPKIECVNGITGFRLDVTMNIKAEQTKWAPQNPTWEPEAEAWSELSPGDKLVAINEQLRRFLIVILATRNTRKETKVDKLARLGIGSNRKQSAKHRYTHITTISLPRPEEMEDDHEHKPTGIAKAAHLRRGHIRNQHYGPKMAYVKRIWIEPVFVNADPSFVSTREAYNLVAP